MSIDKRISIVHLRSLREAFRMSRPVKTPATPGMKVDTRAIIAKQSMGNASLQLGKYITEKDIDARREDVCNYDFRAACNKNTKKK
jgi:hypothetical protein